MWPKALDFRVHPITPSCQKQMAPILPNVQCPMSAADIGTIANKHLCISLAVYAPIKVGSAPNVVTNVIWKRTVGLSFKSYCMVGNLSGVWCLVSGVWCWLKSYILVVHFLLLCLKPKMWNKRCQTGYDHMWEFIVEYEIWSNININNLIKKHFREILKKGVRSNVRDGWWRMSSSNCNQAGEVEKVFSSSSSSSSSSLASS